MTKEKFSKKTLILKGGYNNSLKELTLEEKIEILTNEINNANTTVNNLKFVNQINTNDLSQNLKINITGPSPNPQAFKKEFKENQEQILGFNNNKITDKDGKLNSCLQCDEDKCGPDFKACAGANRRRSCIASDIFRDQDTICKDCEKID